MENYDNGSFKPALYILFLILKKMVARFGEIKHTANKSRSKLFGTDQERYCKHFYVEDEKEKVQRYMAYFFRTNFIRWIDLVI
jgi:hemolysin-activating ACP:hemolysin acyltransferase